MGLRSLLNRRFLQFFNLVRNDSGLQIDNFVGLLTKSIDRIYGEVKELETLPIRVSFFAVFRGL